MENHRPRLLLAIGLTVLAAPIVIQSLPWQRLAPGLATGPGFVSHRESCERDALVRKSGLAHDEIDSGIGYTFAKAGGAFLAPSPTAAERFDRSVKPLERLVLLAVASDEQSAFVRTGDGMACGWIARAAVLISKDLPFKSLADGPLPLSGNAAGIPQPVGMPWRVLFASKDGHGTATAFVRVLATPTGPTRHIRLGGPSPRAYHVFESAPAADNGQGRLLLLGVRDGTTNLVGWVHSHDVTRMSSAQLVGKAAPMQASAQPSLQSVSLGHTGGRDVVNALTLAFEPPTLRILATIAATVCEAIDHRDAMTPLARSIDNLIGHGLRDGQPTPAALLVNVIGLPVSSIPPVLNLSWRALADELRHASVEKRRELKRTLCRVANELGTALHAHKSSSTRPDAGIQFIIVPHDVLLR